MKIKRNPIDNLKYEHYLNFLEKKQVIDRESGFIVPIKKLVLSSQVGEWCQMPYPGHKKGCPNYGKADRCPPKALHVSEYFNLEKPLYFVHSEFDLKAHAERMKERHPNWSDRQCRCVLYWQPKSRKQMKERVGYACSALKTNRVAACPEAMGVNVFATARLSGLHLDKTKSINTCRHISLIGYSTV